MSFFNYVKNIKKSINESDLSESELNEATFSEQNLAKVVKIYSKLIGKKLKGEFKQIGLEEYQRKLGKGKGIRCINDSGEMLRFNWDEKLSKKTSYDLTSIDYWKDTNTDFQKPTKTIVFGPTTNVIQVLDKVIDALKGKKINESYDLIELDDLLELHEAKTAAEKQEWLTAKGLPKSLAGSEKGMRDRAEKLGLSEELEVFLGSKETNTFEDGLQEVQKQMDNKVYADPDTVFEDIEDLLSLVAKKSWKTLVVCGQGGMKIKLTA